MLGISRASVLSLDKVDSSGISLQLDLRLRDCTSVITWDVNICSASNGTKNLPPAGAKYDWLPWMRSRAKYMYFRQRARTSNSDVAMKSATDPADGQKELRRATVAVEVVHIHEGYK